MVIQQMSDLQKRDNAAGKVLVLGDDTRSFLTVVRSLGRRGIEVHVAPIDFSAPALVSKYVHQIHRLPYYTGDGRAWLAATEKLLIREKFDLVIPCDDRFFIPFQLHQARLGAHARITSINDTAFHAFYDKAKTRELAISCRVPVAEGRVLRYGDDVRVVCRELSPPFFLKAVSSYYAENLYTRNKVLRFESLELLSEHIKKSDVTGEYIVEERFDGLGVGLGVLASNGRILQAFQYRRVHEPPSGGGSSYRASMPVARDIRLACSRLVAGVNFTGVAMFEFRYNAITSAWILIEVNGRFWGGLPLAVAAGADFPYRLFRLVVHGEEAPQDVYKTDFFARNLINDLYCFFHELGAIEGKGPGPRLRFLLNRIGEFRHLLFGAEAIDTFVRDDPRPGLRELRDFFTHAFSRLPGIRLAGMRLTRRRAEDAVENVRSAAQGPLKIAFVCFGNICRSPFAELLLKKRLQELQNANAGPIDLSVISAGTNPIEGRTSPDEAIRSSQKWGVDLGANRSRFLDDESAGDTDLILTFDHSNVSLIRARHPDIAAPIVLLGALSRSHRGSLEIEDPYGGGSEMFENIYDQIAKGVDGLLETLVRKHGSLP